MDTRSALARACPNVKQINSSNDADKLELKEITKRTLIVQRDSFNIQAYDGTTTIGKNIYYIQKYKKIFTYEQAVEFLNKKSKEQFILISDRLADKTSIWIYLVSKPNLLTIHMFHCLNSGHMTEFATLQNVNKKLQWAPAKIYPDEGILSVEEGDNEYSYSERNKIVVKFKLGDISTYNSHQYTFYLINTDFSCDSNTLMRDFLKIEGITRVTRERDGYKRFFHYRMGINPSIEQDSIAKRYGLPSTFDRGAWGYRYGDGYILDHSNTIVPTIKTEDKKRIYARINAVLDEQAQKDPLGLVTHSVILIDKPLKGHRRPTFHFFEGFRTNGVTDIVELFTGELLTKDMIPEVIYALTEDGRYCLTSYSLFTQARSKIVEEADIDLVSFEKWTEEKSFNPTLVKTLNENYFDNIDLELIGILNRLPFGCLLTEQMIKTGHAQKAISLASYINQHAYRLNAQCNSLGDLFPGCHENETSIYKILNFSKPVAKYFLEDDDDSIANLITKYKVITHFGCSEVLSNTGLANVENYLKLVEEKINVMYLSFGNRTFDFIDHPDLTKIVIRMLNKIRTLEEKGYSVHVVNNIERQYREIVKVYVSFLDYQTLLPEEERAAWEPENQNIFLEFSLTGSADKPLNPEAEMKERERHANMALNNYRDKADQEARRQNELSYKFRKLHALSKLESTATFEKENKVFKGYRIIAPSQVYGLNVAGSIEKEGYDMNHCVFRSYATSIAKGTYTVMYLRLANKLDESYVTIGINENGQINQTYGKDDEKISPDQAKIIAEWATSKKGKVHFYNGEGCLTRPGGWPSNMNVPELERPDKEWIVKLAQTE